MSAHYVVVIESGLSSNSYGAKISTTDLMDERAGLELIDRIIRGEAPDVYTLHKKGLTVRVSDRVFLDLSTSRATPSRQTRITLAEVLVDRS